MRIAKYLQIAKKMFIYFRWKIVKKKRNQTEELKESLPKLWQVFFFLNSKRKESSSSGNGDGGVEDEGMEGRGAED